MLQGTSDRDGTRVCFRLHAPVCACEPPASRKMCVPLIYNHQRKQNCKSHPQIFLIEMLATSRHVVNSQEQAGLPLALVPSSSLLPWACGESWVGSMRSLWLPAEVQFTQEVAVHQKCWLPSWCSLGELQRPLLAA